MLGGLVILGLLALLSGSPSSSPPRVGPGPLLPGVPPDLQRAPAPPSPGDSFVQIDSSSMPYVPPATAVDDGQAGPGAPRVVAAPASSQDEGLTVVPGTERLTTEERSTPGRGRQAPRYSITPEELPSSPELARLPVSVRAHRRDLARAAIAAVRGRGRSYDQVPVRLFQEEIGLRADGLWGRQTASNAALYTGGLVPAPVY